MPQEETVTLKAVFDVRDAISNAERLAQALTKIGAGASIATPGSQSSSSTPITGSVPGAALAPPGPTATPLFALPPPSAAAFTVPGDGIANQPHAVAPPAPGIPRPNAPGGSFTLPPPAGAGLSTSSSGYSSIHIASATIVIASAMVTMQAATGSASLSNGAANTNQQQIGSALFPASGPAQTPAVAGNQAMGLPAPSILQSIQQMIPSGGQGVMTNLAQHFLSSTPQGQAAISALQTAAQFLPAGATPFIQGASGFLAAAAGPMAIAAGAAKIGTDIWSTVAAGQMSRYRLASQIMAAERRGEYIAPEIRHSRELESDAEGGLEKMESARSSIFGWAGRIASLGAADIYWNYYSLPVYQRNIQNLAADTARVALGRRERALGFDMGTAPGSTAQLAVSVAESRQAFGSRAVGEALRAHYGRQLAGGSSESDIARAQNVIDSVGMQADQSEIYDKLAQGASPKTEASAVLPVLISRGDASSIAALRQGGLLSTQQADSAIKAARSVTEIGNDERMASAALQHNQAAIGYYSARGAGYQTRASLMNQGAAGLDAIRSTLQRRLDVATTAPERAELQAQIASVMAQQEAARHGAVQTRYQGRDSVINTAISTARTRTEAAMYGSSEGVIVAGFNSQAEQMERRARLLDDMSQESRFSPEERARYAQEATQVRQQAKFGLAREFGQTFMGIRSGQIEVAASYREQAANRAQLFGGIDAEFHARVAQVATGSEQAAMLRQELNGDYGPRIQAERLQIEARLNRVLEQNVVAIEQATRAHLNAAVQVAQTGTAIASAQQSRAFAQGVGGVRGFDYAEATYSKTLATAVAAQSRVAALRARGVAEDNPELQSALAASEEAETRAVQTGIGRAQVPISVGLRREASALSYTEQILQMTPGAYGSTRAVLGKHMNNLEQQAAEVMARREAQKRANGGSLSAAEEEAYDQQLQQLGIQQAGLFQQLSFGWENQMVSQAINTPASFAYSQRGISQFAAVRSGIKNPHWGATREELPYFLKMASMMPSLAGSTGTQDGFAVSALTGVEQKDARDIASATAEGVRSGLEGISLILKIPLPGGGFYDAPARILTNGNQQDNSRAAWGEQFRERTGRQKSH